MNAERMPLNLKGNGTIFNVNAPYLIKELTFRKEWITAKYSHREERNDKYFFIFNIDDENIYLIECPKCRNALYEITPLK